jgi:hypothetical protein
MLKANRVDLSGEQPTETLLNLSWIPHVGHVLAQVFHFGDDAIYHVGVLHFWQIADGIEAVTLIFTGW